MSQENVEIDIDLTVLAHKLVSNPAFIKAVAEAIRISQTKQVRSMGNLYGHTACLLYTSPSPRDRQKSRMPSSA